LEAKHTTQNSFNSFYFDDIFEEPERELIKTLTKNGFKADNLAITNFT